LVKQGRKWIMPETSPEQQFGGKAESQAGICLNYPERRSPAKCASDGRREMDKNRMAETTRSTYLKCWRSAGIIPTDSPSGMARLPGGRKFPKFKSCHEVLTS